MTTRRSSPRTRRVSNDTSLEAERATSVTPNPKEVVSAAGSSSNDDTKKNIIISPDSEALNAVKDVVLEAEAVASSVVKTSYDFNGVNYSSYLEMVNAKRQRNQEVLEQSGLLTLVQQRRSAVMVTAPKRTASATRNGLRAQRPEVSKRPRRTSSRLQGVAADGRYVEDERAGKVTVRGVDTAAEEAAPSKIPEESTYRRRFQDGAPISIHEAMEHAGTKWMTEHSVRHAESFLRSTLVGTEEIAPNTAPESSAKHPIEMALWDGLECNDADRNVAKVCPDRIYSMAVHPSCRDLIVCAGDKSGHVGIWQTAAEGSSEEEQERVHLFRPHSGAVCALQWTAASSSSCSNLLSASYDGTIRLLDVEQEKFLPIFATYSDEAQCRDRPGYGLGQQGHKFWTQYICLDPRWNHQDCFFLSTSIGTAMHIDLRIKEPVTFHETLSEKKINTLRSVWFRNSEVFVVVASSDTTSHFPHSHT
jgi:WD40 repeat protein